MVPQSSLQLTARLSLPGSTRAVSTCPRIGVARIVPGRGLQMNHVMPPQRRSESKQDYQTDPDFVRAVVRRWGPIDFDLAAHADNRQAPRYFSKAQNSLVQDWGSLKGTLWLNPEFADIDPWAAKCARTRLQPGSRILFLTPASVSTNWFADHVYGRARVIACNPRLTFVGHVNAFPKDIILSVFGEPPAFCCWRWDR